MMIGSDAINDSWDGYHKENATNPLYRIDWNRVKMAGIEPPYAQGLLRSAKILHEHHASHMDVHTYTHNVLPHFADHPWGNVAQLELISKRRLDGSVRYIHKKEEKTV